MIEETFILLEEIRHEVCDDIIKAGHTIGFEQSKIYRDNETISDSSIRNCKLAWIPKSNEFANIWDMAIFYFDQINRNNYNFDISHGVWEMHVCRYDSETKDHFNWHHDALNDSPTHQRKISMTIQLSEPSSYEGGDLLIGDNVSEEPDIKTRNRGSIITFHSMLRHRVTPVTKGVRYSLVAWADGPPFR